MTHTPTEMVQRPHELFSERTVSLLFGALALSLELAWLAALGYGALSLVRLLA